MSRRLLLALLLATACGDDPEAAPPAGARSSGGEAGAVAAGPAARPREAPPPPPPLPAPIDGAFTLPIRVPLSLIAERIDAGLPTEHAEGWRDLTRPGKSPALRARFQVWRDPVRVSFAGSTLRVEVPLRYAARFDARMKNPLTGKWFTLARDEPWGTPKDPQRARVVVQSAIGIDRDFALSLKTTVAPPEHGPAPSGKLCTRGAFKLCVSRETLTPQVRKQIDGELMPRLRAAARELDARALRFVRLRERLEGAWASLARPVPLGEHGRHLRIAPTHAALELRGDADAVIVEPGVAARLTYHEGPPAQGTAPARPLPPRTPLADLPGERIELPPGLLPFDPEDLLQHL